MSAADNQIKSFMADGGFDHLAGQGKPLPERTAPPWIASEEAVLKDAIDHLSRERDGLDADDKAVYRASAIKSEIADQRRKKPA